MDAIETKALALVNEVRLVMPLMLPEAPGQYGSCWVALCRAIEQHEAFRQEVSDKAQRLKFFANPKEVNDILDTLIIPKPDPLVEALTDCLGRQSGQGEADDLRAAIEKRGGKITFSGDKDHD